MRSPLFLSSLFLLIAVYRCNEVLFGITSIDPLFALAADEVSLNAGHRMTRMAGHILQQQSFYPSFPAPNNSLAPVESSLLSPLINSIVGFEAFEALGDAGQFT